MVECIQHCGCEQWRLARKNEPPSERYSEVIKMRTNTCNKTGPRILPIAQLGKIQYFVDLRLRQFRDVNNPHNYVDFNSEQGRQMCEHTGVVECKACRMSVMMSMAMFTDELRCMNCMTLLVPRVIP